LFVPEHGLQRLVIPRLMPSAPRRTAVTANDDTGHAHAQGGNRVDLWTVANVERLKRTDTEAS
jgi:hypothetical protein